MQSNSYSTRPTGECIMSLMINLVIVTLTFHLKSMRRIVEKEAINVNNTRASS